MTTMLILQISRSRNPRDANVVSEYSDAKEKRANRLYWQSEKVTGGGVEQQQANSNSDGQMEGGRTRRRRAGNPARSKITAMLLLRMMMAKVAAATGYVATAKWTHNKESNSTESPHPNRDQRANESSPVRIISISSSSSSSSWWRLEAEAGASNIIIHALNCRAPFASPSHRIAQEEEEDEPLMMTRIYLFQGRRRKMQLWSRNGEGTGKSLHAAERKLFCFSLLSSVQFRLQNITRGR